MHNATATPASAEGAKRWKPFIPDNKKRQQRARAVLSERRRRHNRQTRRIPFQDTRLTLFSAPVRLQLVLENVREVGVLEPRVEGGDAALQVSESPVRHRSTEICTGIEFRGIDERRVYGFTSWDTIVP